MAGPVSQEAAAAIAKVVRAGLGLSVLGYAGYSSLYTVDGGHRAVVFNRFSGIKQQPVGEGTHFRIPWVERPFIFDVRTQQYQRAATTGTRDLQTVHINLRVLHKPFHNSLPKILSTLGEDYSGKVLPSVANETLKNVIAQYNAPQLTTQREEVSRRIRADLTERARAFGIQVEDVSLVSLDFGDEYTRAVEQKQVAQQEAERARWMVEQAVQDKKSTVIKAKGDAQAAKLLGEAMKSNQDYLEIKRLEAAREIAATLARSKNRIYLDSESLLVNLGTPFQPNMGKK